MVDYRDPNKGARAADELGAALANMEVEIDRLLRSRNDYQARVIPAETEVVRLQAVVADLLPLVREAAGAFDILADECEAERTLGATGIWRKKAEKARAAVSKAESL